MTPDPPDMTTPVTRGELREDLAQLDPKFKQWLEIWGGALLVRIESTEQRLNQRIESTEQRLNQRIELTEQRLNQCIELAEQRLHAELARHTSAICESMAAQIKVIDEKYADLPARARQLEANVVPRKRR
jgi:vacuolar-type H+-ATPase subunit I/STV1